MGPLSAFSMAQKLAGLHNGILSVAQKEKLLNSFSVETSEHALFMMEVLISSLHGFDQERDRPLGWYQAISDDTMTTEQRVKALSDLRTTFLRMIRSAHDPALGNRMLAAAVAGLAPLAYPEDLKVRVQNIALQITPADIDLLVRLVVEGISKWAISAEGGKLWYRELVQEDWVFRILREDGLRSSPLDPYAYDSLVRHSLIQQYVVGNLEPSRGQPMHLPLGPPPATHEPLRVSWRLGIFGLVAVEAFTNQSMQEILQSEIGPPEKNSE